MLKIKLVEVHPLHQVPKSFRLKRGQARITDSSKGGTREQHYSEAFYHQMYNYYTFTKNSFLFVDVIFSRKQAEYCCQKKYNFSLF